MLELVAQTPGELRACGSFFFTLRVKNVLVAAIEAGRFTVPDTHWLKNRLPSLTAGYVIGQHKVT